MSSKLVKVKSNGNGHAKAGRNLKLHLEFRIPELEEIAAELAAFQFVGENGVKLENTLAWKKLQQKITDGFKADATVAFPKEQ